MRTAAVLMSLTCSLKDEIIQRISRSGHDRQKRHDYGYSSSWSSKSSSYGTGGSNFFDKSKSGGFGDLIVLLVIGVVIYAMYKTCLAGNGQQMGDRQYR